MHAAVIWTKKNWNCSKWDWEKKKTNENTVT